MNFVHKRQNNLNIKWNLLKSLNLKLSGLENLNFHPNMKGIPNIPETKNVYLSGEAATCNMFSANGN